MWVQAVKAPTMRPACTNGLGYREDHEAEGWIISPEGRPIIAMCRRQAEKVINEYREKLGEEWTFRPYER